MNLWEYIPYTTYHGEAHVMDYQKAVDTELQKLLADYDDFKLQLSPITATWGLAFYEKEYGIRIEENKNIEERRANLIARMRRHGTTTVKAIKSISSAFSKGEVEVVEHNEEYWFELNFTSHEGIPPNIEDLLAIVEEVKPAHLGMSYTERFNTHRYLSDFTHKNLSLYTHYELRTKKLEKHAFRSHHELSAYIHTKLAESTHKALTEKE